MHIFFLLTQDWLYVLCGCKALPGHPGDFGIWLNACTSLNLVRRFPARHKVFCFTCFVMAESDLWIFRSGSVLREELGRQMLLGAFRKTLDCFTNVRLPTAARKFINDIAFREHW